MNKLLLAFVAVCFFAFSSCTKEDAKIYGTVVYSVNVDDNGAVIAKLKPAAGATVRLYNGYSDEGEASSGLTPRATVKTDSKGGFVFDGLPQGNYYLTAFVEVEDVFEPGGASEKVKLSNGAYNTIAVMVIEGQAVKRDITVDR